jgi:hypothetical protein
MKKAMGHPVSIITEKIQPKINKKRIGNPKRKKS